jgi:putative phosphoribosyl transferase
MAYTTQQELIGITANSVQLEGMLELPDQAAGVVLFAHGTGSGRLSPRNHHVARELHNAGLGTLLMDLLTMQEAQIEQARFDIGLLSTRLAAALDWLRHAERTHAMPVGLFGASTGAAAALLLAAERGAEIGAVVSRGGRADLAGRENLAKVSAPTLLIVGALDDAVIELNRMAFSALHCERRMEIVPQAGHLFEEPGTLNAVAELAADWFLKHLESPGMAG